MAQYSLYRPWAAAPRGGAFEQFRHEMDALLNRFDTGRSRSGGSRGVYPAVNLYETPEAYMLMAELPGLATEDIDVSLEGSTVTLQGGRKIDYAHQEGVSLHRRERQVGSFRRAFELPVVIEADKVDAVHKNGVLLLRLPKSAASQPRQISVQAG
jgi:HSP20 family protein